MLCTGQDYPTPKQIRNILNPEASGVAVQWYDLGIQLLDDDGPGVLNVIKADHPNDAKTCCSVMFEKWLLKKPDATWSQLAAALTKLGMNSVAADLKKQLQFGKHNIMYLSHGMVVLYIRVHGVLGFCALQNYLKNNFLQNSLAALARHSQVQNCLQKGSQIFPTSFD